MNSTARLHAARPIRAAAPATSSNLVLKTGGVLFVAVWTLTLMAGAWDYLFKRLLHVHSPSVTLMTILLLAMFSLRLFQRRTSLLLPVPDLVGATWVFAAYLLLAAMVNANTQNASFILILLTFYIYFFYLMFFSASPLLVGSVSPGPLAAYLAVLAVVLSAIGVAQALTKNLFAFGYYITSSINSINVTTAGRVRASAVFAHADDFGVFLCIPLAIAIHKLFVEKRLLLRGVWLFVALCAIAGCVATLTRVVYLAMVVVILVTAWGTLRARTPRPTIFPSWMPLLLLAGGFSLFFMRYAVEAILMNVDALKDYRYLLSAKSLDERLYGLRYYVSQLDAHGSLGWIFGLGWAFSSNLKSLVPIDNGFQAVVVSSGLVGLLLWLWISWRCWTVVNRLAADRENVLGVPFAAFFGAWLLLAVFGLYLEPFMVAVLMVSTLGPDALRKLRTRTA